MLGPRHSARRTIHGLLPFVLAACGGDADTAAMGSGASLGEPTAVFPEDFGTIQTVREMSDGRVLVADPLGNALYLVDMDAGTRTVLGREGAGPGEYRQPDAVWALPGGSSLLIDLGNGRTTTLGPELTFGETSPLTMGEFRPGSTMVLALPQGMDDRGRIYTRALGGGFDGEPPDSAAILRVDRETAAVDTVGNFKLQDRTQSTSGDANNRRVSISSIPLSPEDAWGVAPDGSVVIARSSDYHIEWLGPDGSVTSGPPTPFETIAIGTAEKEEFIQTSGRSGGGIGISVTVDNGAVQMNFSRGGSGGGTREIDSYDWPDTKPPFYSGRLDVDGEGRAWVRRHVEAGAEATYDLFDRRGERVGTIKFANNRRVIGFGAFTVYVVAYDEVDLNYLERYALPST